VLAYNQHPPPTLEDMAERPQIRVDRARSTPARTGPGRRQTRRHGPAGLARAAPDRSPAQHRSRHGSSHPGQSSLRSVTAPARASRHAHPRRRWARPSSSDCFLSKADGRFADGDSAGILPNTIQHSGDWHDPPHGQGDAAQGALLSSDDCGWSVERTGRLHPLWQRAFEIGNSRRG